MIQTIFVVASGTVSYSASAWFHRAWCAFENPREPTWLAELHG